MRIYFKLFPKGSRCQIRFLLLFPSLGVCQARKSRDPADDGRSPENATPRGDDRQREPWCLFSELGYQDVLELRESVQPAEVVW